MSEAAQRRAEKRQARAAQRSVEMEALKNRGNDLVKGGDYEAAVEVYQLAIDAYGNKPVLLSNLAAALLKNEEQEAEDIASTALTYDPRMIKARVVHQHIAMSRCTYAGRSTVGTWSVRGACSGLDRVSPRGLARKGMRRLKAAISGLIGFESLRACVDRHTFNQTSRLEQDPTRTEAREQLKITQELYAAYGDDEYDVDDDDYDWPHCDDEPETESEVESDSSDCRHFGNGFPCRFYDHDGCMRKDGCRYSHAPDEKSIRDKLSISTPKPHIAVLTMTFRGKNVCIAFLVDICKFGAKCIYSHDREYLPIGWWNRPTSVSLLKSVFEDDSEGVDKDTIDDILFDAFELSGPEEEVYYTGFAQVVEEETTQRAQSYYRAIISSCGAATEDYKRPTLTALRDTIPVKTAVSVKEALTHLASPNLAGVFVADAALVERKHSQVLAKLVPYVKAGGSVVFGGSFSSFVSPHDLATFFANNWGVNWRSGSYHRATFTINRQHYVAESNPGLPTAYSMKALHVTGITLAASVYHELGASPIESPVVQIPCGSGHMGYIGDVNWENGSISVLFAMLHLPRSVPSTTSTAAKSTPPLTSNVADPSYVPSTQDKITAYAPSSSNQRFILLLALEGDVIESYKQPIVAAIKAKSQVKIASSAKDALTHLASSDLDGVFVVNGGITKRQYSDLVTKLVAYVKSGGIVLIGGSFSTFVKPKDMGAFFENSWGVNWKPGSYHRTTFFLNPSHDLAKANPCLPDSISMKALHVKSIMPEVMVYRPTAESRVESAVFTPKPVPTLAESPAVQARVGLGYLNYIGDVNWDVETSKLVLAMFRLLHPQLAPQPQVTQTSTPKPAPPTAKGAKPKQPAAASTSSKPYVMLLSLKNEDFFAITHAQCLSALRDKLETNQALTAASAIKMLNTAGLAGVFVTDPGIVRPENANVLARLVEFVKSGGSVVVGGFFSTFVFGNEMDAWFKNAWGLSWKGGSYHRTTFSRNASHELVANNPAIVSSYSMKALHLGGLAEGDAVYLAADDARLQSMVFQPVKVTNHSESPVVQRRIGDGFIGYIGDVNAEKDTTTVLMAMLGLLDPPPQGPQSPTKPEPIPAPNVYTKVKAEPATAPKPPTDVAPAVGVAEQNVINKLPAGPTSRPFMMVLSFGNEKFFAGVQCDLLDLLRSKLEVLHGLSNERVLELLGSPDLVGILVTDSAIADKANTYLLGKLVAFTKAGGKVVLGGSFSSSIRFDKMGQFFQNWGVPWKGGDYTRADIAVNGAHELVQKNPGMPSAFCLKGLHVEGITPETAVYLPTQRPPPAKKASQAPVALTRVDQGYLGYIGDVGLQDEHSKIVLAMFGLL
ncbi:hypothetical protein DXG03_005884 [Asterophora parasitica]|uniref:C3H1-type domain-containing protein n=1 Tax=Asterophora parasitica TaxID=117018 RepID=A0A9P7K9P5_9AGAR|nr:hypothetical protein DXG03_005884 [Asterophora parasitica]